MSQSTDRQVPAAQSVRVPAAAPNVQSEIASVAGAKLQLEFDPTSASVDRVDNSLVFTFDNGGKVTVVDFFVTGGAALPNLQLPDGTEVASADILASLNADMDLSTAAGPGAQASPPGGGTNYADDGGTLIGGLDRLGSLGTDYWDRTTEVPDDDLRRGLPALTMGFGEANALLLSASSVNESEDAFSLTFNLSFAAASPVVVTLRIDGTGANFGDAFNDDVNMPLGAVLSGPAADGSYLLTVTIPAGQSSYTVAFPLNDDHINETDENITFTVVNTVGASGSVGQSATVTITDDTVPADGDPATAINEMDGPIVGVTLHPTDTDGLKEGFGDQVFNFQLTLTDPHTGAPYAGYTPQNGTPDGVLSQDMTIVLKLGTGTGVYGEDFTFSQAELNDLLAIDGVKSVTLHDDGSITLDLAGRVGPDGQPHGETPFNLADVDKLVINATIINDTLTELDDKTFTLEVDSVEGNESQVGAGASGTIIKDDAEHLNGPKVSLSVTGVNESGANDPAYAPTDDKTGKITIDLRGGRYINGTADEDIHMTLTIGKAGDLATYGSGDPAAIDSPVDYYLTGDWASTGADTYTMTVTLQGTDGRDHDVVLSRTDNADGTATITFTMPKECNTLEIGYASNDDLRELEGEEAFTVNLTLDEKGNGLPYGEATLEGKTAAESIPGGGGTSQSAIITPDAEANFDGPYVAFASGNVGTALEGGTLAYTLQLRDPANPANPAALFTSLEEAVTVTLKVSFTDTMQAHDLVFYASAGGSVVENPASVNGLYIKLGDGNFAQVTATSDGFTFEVEFPEGAGQTGSLSFALEINDDRYGGVELEGGIAGEQQAHDKPTEAVKIEIFDVSGNEARINAAPEINANGDTASLNTSSEGTILDDGTSSSHAGGALDGPTIGLSVAGETGEELGLQEMEDGVKSVTVTLTDGGYTADGGKLVEAATVRIEIDLKGASYPGDFDITFPAGVSGSVNSDDPSGKVYVTLSLPAGTDPGAVSFQVNIKDDDVRETGEGFTIKVVDVEGNESSVDGTLHTVTIEDDYHEPLVSLGFEASVKESGANDTAWAPQDNLTRYSINLGHDRPGGTGNEKINPSEDVKVTLKIEGQNGTAGTETVFNPADPNAAGTPQAGEDAYWAQMGTWQLDLDGTTYSNPTYDSTSGTLTFTIAGGTFVITDIAFKADGSVSMTIPKDSLGNSIYDTVSIKVGVGITDDMRQDESGEKLHATLTVNSDEATLSGTGLGTTVIDRDATADSFDGPYVALSGTTDIDEGTGGARSNVATYTINLIDPQDGTSLFAHNNPAEHETVTVTLSVKGLSGNFTSGDINWSGITVNGVALGASNYNAATGTITVQIPVGSNSIVLGIPAADDHFGGVDPATDALANNQIANDTAEERFSLTITDVSGNEARVTTSTTVNDGGTVNLGIAQETVIHDDGVGGGKLDGPVIHAVLGKTTTAENTNVTLKLEFKDPGNSALSYKNPAGGTTLVEETRVQLHFGGENTPAQFGIDYTITKPSTVSYGSITLSFTLPDGTTFNDFLASNPNFTTYSFTDSNGNPLTSLEALKAATGEVSVTYSTTDTSVGLPPFMDSADLRAHNVGIEADVTYKIPSGTDVGSGLSLTVAVTNDTYTEDAEGIKVTVVDTEGNESTAGTGSSLAITDEMGGRISIANAPEALEGNDLVFKLSVTGTTISSGLNFNENVVITLQLAGKDGAGLDAASLADIDFAKLQAANPGIAINSYDSATGAVTITLSHDDWTHATSTSHSYELHIPTKVDSLLAEAREGVQVSITGAKGAEINFSASTGTSATGTIKDEAGLRISGDKVIYEDSASAPQDGKTFATYHVEVLDKFVAVGDGGGKVAGQDFRFDITLQDGTASFDSNIQNNYVNVGDPTSDLLHNSNVGDYGWAVGGKIVQYGDLTTESGKADLMNAINDFLGSDSKYDGIRVTGVTNGGRSLTFEVSKDARIDALENMPIQVAAIDDAVTEGDQGYTVRIGNIVEKGTTDGYESLGTNEDRVGSGNVKTNEGTTIKDDSADNSRDGYYVGLKAATAAESSGGAIVPVAFFQHGADGKIIDADPDNPPSSQGFTLTFGTKDKGATQNEDFVVDDSTVPVPVFSGTYVGAVGTPGESDYVPAHWENTGNWSYVEASGATPAHWEYKADLSAYIPLKDDRFTEGDEDFVLELKSVSGHESSILPGTDPVGTVSNTVTITIEDDKTLADGPYKLDGPEISFFGPTGKVIEPVAPDKTSSETVEPQKVSYVVGLSQTAAQDVVLFINIPNVGDDFTLDLTNAAFGVLTPEKLEALKAEYPHYNLEPNGAGYFLIIPKGQSSGEITVQILHDHDSSSVVGGVDDAIQGSRASEHVHMEITNMQGSEARYTPGDAANTTHTPIQDDMRGPVVSFEVSGNRLEWSGQSEPLITIKLPVSCDEDVTVRIELRDASGNLLMGSDGKPAYLTHTFINGTAGSVELNIAQLLAEQHPGTTFSLGNDFFIKIAGVTGGEAGADTNLIYMDHDSGTSTVLNNFRASDISEEHGETVVYTLDLKIPSGYTIPDGGISFNLKVLDNGTSDNPDDFTTGRGTITVSIPKDQLDLLPKDAINNITIKQDGVYLGDEKIGTVEGALPSARDDSLVEGDEGFYTIITNPSGGLDIDDAVADSKIIDNDKPIVKVEFVDANGNVLDHAPEGGEVYVRVSLVDSDGNPVTLGGGAAEFELTFTGGINPGEATEGSDFYSTFGHVTVPGGASQSDLVKVVLPDDFISEGDETFSVSAKYVEDAYSHYADETLFDTVEGSDLIINDHINGPQILSFAGTASASEREGKANYTVTLDKSLEEEAELTFKLDLSTGDTKDGFVITEIDTIKVDGVTYTISADGLSITTSAGVTYEIGDLSQKVHLGADGDLYVTMTMGDRSVRESFEVTLRNDLITDPDEKLLVTLVDTKGGELHLGGGLEVTPGNGPSVTTTVKDYLDGPVVSLNKLDASGTEGESVSVSIGLSKETVSDTTIVLQLGNGVAADVVEGTQVTVSNGGGFSGTGSIDPDTGKVTIVLPEGTSGPLTVTFPLQDNVVTGENSPFSVSLGGAGALVGGETTLAGSLSFGSSFAGETNNSMTFEMSGTGTVQADAQGTLTLGNIIGGVNSVDHITLTYPGSPPTVVLVAASELRGSGSTLTYSWNATAGSSLADVRVDVVFKPGVMTPEELASTKLNATVEGALSGMSVTVNVNDDATDTSLADGPVFSVVPHATGTAEEASTVTFTLGAALKPGYEVIADPDGISITFKLTGSYAGNVTGLSYGGAPLTANNGGTYTITLPKGTDLTEWLKGDNTITAALKGVDSTISVDGTLGLEITKVEQGEALGVGASGSATVTDVTEGELIFSTATSSATEGSTTTVSIKLVNPANNNTSITAEEAITVTVKVTGDALNSSDMTIPSSWELQADGSYLFTVIMAKNSSMASFNFSTKADTLLEGPEGLQFTIVGRKTPTLNDNIAVSDDNVTHGFTLNDAAAKVVVTAGDVTEGEDVVFNLALKNSSSNGALQSVAGTVVLVTIGMPSGMLLDGYTDGYGNTVTWTDLKNDTYTASVALAAGQTGINIIIPTETDGVIGSVALDHITLTEVSVSIGGSVLPVSIVDGANVAVGGAHGVDVAVTDAEYAQLPDGAFNPEDVAGLALVHVGDSHTVDASASTTGVFVLGSGESDSLTGSNHGDVIYGGAGNDTIHGGEGNDLIFAGKGDDILFGGAGADTFSWNVDSHDSGTDVIRGFSYSDGDKLCIGIMAEDDQILNLHDVLDPAGSNLDVYLAATVNDADITLKVTSGDMEQTIVLEMGAGTVGEFGSYDEFRTAYTGADEDDQAAMLQQLLISITC